VQIKFPEEINSQNTDISYYSGVLGSKGTSLAIYSWTSTNTLEFTSTGKLKKNEGITASVTMPKGIFAPYQKTFFEKYNEIFGNLFFFLPLISLIFMYLLWRKFGRDPKIKSPVPPEFGIPQNISPVQMATVIKSGSWRDSSITAAIINFAVKKILVIKELNEKILFFKYKDLKLRLIADYKNVGLTETEILILDTLFPDGKNEIKLSEIKKDRVVAENISEIKRSAFNDSVKNGWLAGSSVYMPALLVGLAAGVVFILVLLSVIFLGITDGDYLTFFVKMDANLAACAVIIILFALLMPRRTQKGADLMFQILGFERYMKQAEDYRQQFYEKENIFDKFLPYAIVFGITSLWIRKMEDIYGKDFYKNYHPAWYAGAISSTFDADSFTSQINSIAHNISSSTSSSSGAGGAGGAGGGGGGGGGGGW